MYYINDNVDKVVLYRDLVNMVVNSGIELTRAYIYLAGRGIRGEHARLKRDDGSYNRPVKVAMYGDDTLVTSVETCKCCKTLIIK